MINEDGMSKNGEGDGKILKGGLRKRSPEARVKEAEEGAPKERAETSHLSEVIVARPVPH